MEVRTVSGQSELVWGFQRLSRGILESRSFLVVLAGGGGVRVEDRDDMPQVHEKEADMGRREAARVPLMMYCIELLRKGTYTEQEREVSCSWLA